MVRPVRFGFGDAPEHFRRRSAMQRMVRTLWAGALTLGGLTFTMPSAAPAAAQSTLTGEFFLGTASYTTGSCSNSAPTSFTFTASGAAHGPYPGTFTERGSFTVLPMPGGLGQFTKFEATFEIESPAGNVTGTKSLRSPKVDNYVCAADGFRVFLTGADVTYTARIETAGGSSQDRGTGFVNLFNPPADAYFNEGFTSQPLAPTDKDQCKDEGHRNFIDPRTGEPFKNQGQCVSFVEQQEKKR